MPESVRDGIKEQSVIYHTTGLTDFQKKVNAAAAEIALRDPTLVHKGNRGKLLDLARQQVSGDGYIFKKGKSCSKLYGEPSPPAKRTKISESLRSQRMVELRDEIESIDNHLRIKEKRLGQSEASQNYAQCDRFYEEIRELKGARREKSRELVQLQVKEKRAVRYRNTRINRSPVTEHSWSGTATPSPEPASSSGEAISPVFRPKVTTIYWLHEFFRACWGGTGDSTLSAFLAQPPHCMDVVGRHPLEQELTQHNAILIIYRQQNKKTLCDKLQQKVSNNIYVSLFSGLSLCDYVTARTIFCELHHKHPCTQCIPLLNIAKYVLENGHIQLSTAFKQAYPTQKYKTDIAISRLLRMPLICIKPHEQNIWFLFEQVVGLDVLKFFHLTNALFCAKKVTSSLHKSEVQSIMSLAQSDRERELICYSIFRASGLSYTGAQKTFGFEAMKGREARVMKAIDEARAVSEMIDDLANTADLALLHSMGIDISTESDLELSSSDDESSCTDSELPDLDVLLKVLEAAKYNWFEVRDYLEKTASCDHESPSLAFLTSVFSKLMSSITSPESKILLEQSYNASLATEKEKELENRLVAQLNGEILSESESDSAVPATMQSPEVKNLIAKKRKNVLRKFKRRKAREIAERRLLSRSVSRRRNTIIDRFPNIGSEIESFVRSCDIGADKWRRTGVLTFDGNVRVNKKVTFQRIKEHLEATYGQKFSYDTVVQLCVARNRRHRAAKNYRGVAKVTSRRARKGSQI